MGRLCGALFVGEFFFVGRVAIGVSPTVFFRGTRIFWGKFFFVGRVAIGKNPTLFSGKVGRGGEGRGWRLNQLANPVQSKIYPAFSAIATPSFAWVACKIKPFLGLFFADG